MSSKLIIDLKRPKWECNSEVPMIFVRLFKLPIEYKIHG